MRSVAELHEQLLHHEQLTGLIAPDGTFYECADCSHWSLKRALFGYNYTDKQIENWLHIGIEIGVFTYQDGLDNREPCDATWSQHKMLDALLSSDLCDYQLKQSIYKYIGE